MLLMLGTLRHQLATDYDLPAVARQFFGKLLQRQTAEWFDPRLAMGRVYEMTTRVNRAVEFVEFLEQQQPLIASLAGSYFGVQRTLQTLRNRAIGIGVAILLVGALLYFVLADPDIARSAYSYAPSFIPFETIHLILAGLMLVLTVMFVANARRLVSR
jgi:hypothetical protein